MILLYEDDEKFNYYYYSHFYDGKMNEFTTNIQTDYNLFSPQCPSLNDFNNTFNNIINISDNSEYKNEDEDKDVDKGELYEQEDPEIILSEYHHTKISQIFEKSEKLKPFLNAFDNNLIDENIQNEIKGNLIKKKRIRRTASEIAKERREKNKFWKKRIGGFWVNFGGFRDATDCRLQNQEEVMLHKISTFAGYHFGLLRSIFLLCLPSFLLSLLPSFLPSFLPSLLLSLVVQAQTEGIL